MPRRLRWCRGPRLSRSVPCGAGGSGLTGATGDETELEEDGPDAVAAMPAGADDAGSSDPDLADVLGQPEAVAICGGAGGGGRVATSVAMVGQPSGGKATPGPFRPRQGGFRLCWCGPVLD